MRHQVCNLPSDYLEECSEHLKEAADQLQKTNAKIIEALEKIRKLKDEL